ncbi:MAG TPA: carboxypeptidase regulatory-like domain-containing protein [Gemmatimonadales bacterium]
MPRLTGAPGTFICSTLFAVAMTAAGRAQTTAALRGQVIDQQSHLPLSGARVALTKTPTPRVTAADGRFAFDSLAPGTYLLAIHAIGYQAAARVVRLNAGDSLDQEVDVAPTVVALDPMVVQGRAGFEERRRAEFEERRQGGRGHFITAADIVAANATNLGDLLRNVPGVQLVCRNEGCQVRMSRSPTCPVEFFVDGLPATFATNVHLPVVGITGIEIYRDESEIPTIFLKGNSSCGVIAIWTKAGP